MPMYVGRPGQPILHSRALGLLGVLKAFLERKGPLKRAWGLPCAIGLEILEELEAISGIS